MKFLHYSLLIISTGNIVFNTFGAASEEEFVSVSKRIAAWEQPKDAPKAEVVTTIFTDDELKDALNKFFRSKIEYIIRLIRNPDHTLEKIYQELGKRAIYLAKKARKLTTDQEALIKTEATTFILDLATTIRPTSAEIPAERPKPRVAQKPSPEKIAAAKAAAKSAPARTAAAAAAPVAAERSVPIVAPVVAPAAALAERPTTKPPVPTKPSAEQIKAAKNRTRIISSLPTVTNDILTKLVQHYLGISEEGNSILDKALKEYLSVYGNEETIECTVNKIKELLSKSYQLTDAQNTLIKNITTEKIKNINKTIIPVVAAEIPAVAAVAPAAATRPVPAPVVAVNNNSQAAIHLVQAVGAIAASVIVAQLAGTTSTEKLAWGLGSLAVCSAYACKGIIGRRFSALWS